MRAVSASLVIANYERLLGLTVQMREAAAQGDWERLIDTERDCSALVDTMKALDAETKLDEAAQRRKKQLISEILADDAEIRGHIRNWMGQMQATMQSARQEQRLLRAYRT